VSVHRSARPGPAAAGVSSTVVLLVGVLESANIAEFTDADRSPDTLSRPPR
jgi:hypothetical protein